MCHDALFKKMSLLFEPFSMNESEHSPLHLVMTTIKHCCFTFNSLPMHPFLSSILLVICLNTWLFFLFYSLWLFASLNAVVGSNNPLSILFWCFSCGGFSYQSLFTFSKCFSCFFSSSSLLYSSLQAGRFTTKRQRESPINLVANHALDSSVDLCLCPSVCICSFLFPFAHFFIHFI